LCHRLPCMMSAACVMAVMCVTPVMWVVAVEPNWVDNLELAVIDAATFGVEGVEQSNGTRSEAIRLMVPDHPQGVPISR
jgi:hypothetical protein